MKRISFNTTFKDIHELEILDSGLIKRTSNLLNGHVACFVNSAARKA